MDVRLAAAALAFLGFAASAGASCGSSSCPLDLHALGLTATSPLVVDLSFQYINQDRLQRGTARGAFGEVPTEHDEIGTINRLTTLQISDRITPRLQLIATAPFVSRSHNHIETAGGAREQWNFGAFGDAALQGRFRIYDAEPAAHRALWISGGVKFPTGARHERSQGADGEEAEVTIQPGSGSTDVLLAASWEGGWLRDTGLQGALGSTTLIPYFASLSFRDNGRGTRGYRRGNEVQFNAGSEYPIARMLDLAAQLNVRHTAKDAVGSTGEDPSLTGGTYVYVSPGVRLTLSRGVSVYGYVQLPLYEDLNGLQLTSRRNYLVGVKQRF